RATAVKTNEITNVAGFIFPGSHVDVLVTLKPDNIVADTQTRTVLQNVQVLSTGTKMDPDPNGKPENVTVVTVLVTPEQSEKLALAQPRGIIHFALRKGADTSISEAARVDRAVLAATPKTPEKPPAPMHSKPFAQPAAKGPDVYSVETLINGKSTITK